MTLVSALGTYRYITFHDLASIPVLGRKDVNQRMLIGEPYYLKDLRADFPNSHTKVEFKGTVLCV